MSSLNLWIQVLQFHACIGGGEAPVYKDSAPVPFIRLRAWDEAGISGVAILESTGLERLQKVIWDDLPLVPAMRDLLGARELHHRTLFTVVWDEETVERVIAATQEVTGDLNTHHTGILFVVPVARALGLDRKWT